MPLARPSAVLSRARRSLPGYADGSSPIASSVRLALLLLAALLATPDAAAEGATLPYLGVVLVLALVGTTVPDARRLKLVLLLGEALVASLGVAVTGQPALPLLVCLSASALGAGLAAGYVGAVVTTGLAAAVLLVGRLAHGSESGAAALSSASAQWTVFALAASLLAGRIHALGTLPKTPEDRYAEAHRLLEQLRAVTRGLPGSLDPGLVARDLMEQCVELTGCEHGAVLLNVGGDQLVPLALHGYQRVPWRASLAEDGPIQRAWLSGAPVLDRREPGRGRAGSSLFILPMTVERHRVGVVALEARTLDAFDAPEPGLLSLVERSALPLETAALFDELRINAAQEERARLAREMHDGIAQDLAFLGYELDALAALQRKAPEQAVDETRRLRKHITGLMSDLRLSISDLRSSVGPGRGLGAALSEYARSAGTSSGITVHMTLAEGSTRLPADAEVQLLRIAHDAVGRARRQPGTRNLWVELEVDPPNARLVVEDDAPDTSEAGVQRNGSHEMEERAARLGARFRSERRVPTGNRVSVTLGESQA